MRRPTLREVGIAGAVVGLAALALPMFLKSLWQEPVATIDSPEMDASVPRCFVARGRVDPATIRRPLWLMKSDAGGRWREVGRVYPPPGTWGSRVCADRDTAKVRLALVLADDELDAKLSGPPVPEPEPEIPDWLSGRCSQDQGGCGRNRHAFVSLPAGATPVAPVVTVHVPGNDSVPSYLAPGRFDFPVYPPEIGRSRSRRATPWYRSSPIAP
jgi:hypothetical protein